MRLTGCYELSEADSKFMRAAVFALAQRWSFQKRQGVNRKRAERLYNLLREAEFCGSRFGGAAGYLSINGDCKLRFALGSPSWRWLFRLALKHELLHFLREVESLEKRNVSLFQAEREASIWGLFFLVLREEMLVWLRTFW